MVLGRYGYICGYFPILVPQFPSFSFPAPPETSCLPPPQMPQFSLMSPVFRHQHSLIRPSWLESALWSVVNPPRHSIGRTQTCGHTRQNPAWPETEGRSPAPLAASRRHLPDSRPPRSSLPGASGFRSCRPPPVPATLQLLWTASGRGSQSPGLLASCPPTAAAVKTDSESYQVLSTQNAAWGSQALVRRATVPRTSVTIPQLSSGLVRPRHRVFAPTGI